MRDDELDVLLDRYAQEAGELWLSALPTEPAEHAFSPKFHRKMRPLLRRQRRSPGVNAALALARRAAVFALVFLALSFSCAVTVSAQFRAEILQIVVSVTQAFTEFRYTSDYETDVQPGDFTLTYLPEGMIEKERDITELSAYIYWEDENGDFIMLDQIVVTQDADVQLGLDTEDAEITRFTIHGLPAMGIVKGLDSTVHWTEEESVFDISGTISLEELKLVAEGLEKNK